jgi:hydroxymethylglutaryl-CoA lyase
MANSSDILEYLLKNKPEYPHPINYSFLAPNVKGFENAMAVLDKLDFKNASSTTSSVTEEDPPALNTSSNDPNAMPSTTKKSASQSGSAPNIEISVFAAATETFSQKNLNCSIETSLKRFEPVIQGARAAGLRVRAYISVVLGCPFEGIDVDPQRVADIARSLLEMGADEISLGDTTGYGTAPRTSELLHAMTAAGVRNEDIAMHFHDTYGQALVNTAVSLEHGIRTFDSSVGGLGGCPYSPGATGNVSTENMIYFMDSLGMETGVDLDATIDVGQWITSEIGKPNSSSVGKAILGKRNR